jgi:hypothetical protein
MPEDLPEPRAVDGGRRGGSLGIHAGTLAILHPAPDPGGWLRA